MCTVLLQMNIISGETTKTHYPRELHHTAAATAAATDDDGGGGEGHGDDASELVKKVFVYAGLPLFCSLVAAWFFCSQTSTLLKRRAKCRRVNAAPASAANDSATWTSRDRAPAAGGGSFTSGDCSLMLSESSSPSADSGSASSSETQSASIHWADRIIPLRPAYRPRHVGLSLDQAWMLHAGDKLKQPAHYSTQSVDVQLLRQLSDCDAVTSSADSDQSAPASSDGPADIPAAVNQDDRLYVETPSQRQRHSQHNRLPHIISVPL